MRGVVSYERYLRSMDWYNRRKKALDRAGNKCEICGSAWKVQVHHLTYDNLGNEKDEDLQALCRKHHVVGGHLEKLIGKNPELV